MAASDSAETTPSGKPQIESSGVRALTIEDQLPDCEVRINRPAYDMIEMVRGKRVLDIGCGYGRNRPIVEGVGGEWIGVEPFEGGAHTVVGSAEDLPFEDASCDVVIMDAVLEHVPDVDAAFGEIGRVLRPNGVFIGYVAFMECFHEISYNHLSFMALQHYSRKHGMEMEIVGGGKRFGIDYHLAVLFYPLPFGWIRPLVTVTIRGIFRLKSWLAYLGLRMARRMTHAQAKDKAGKFYRLECLRQSVGFDYVIRKPGTAG